MGRPLLVDGELHRRPESTPDITSPYLLELGLSGPFICRRDDLDRLGRSARLATLGGQSDDLAGRFLGDPAVKTVEALEVLKVKKVKKVVASSWTD